MGTKPGDKVMFVRMPVLLHRKVALRAKREDRSMAAVVREAIRQYCARASE